MADVTVDMIIEALAKNFDKVEKDLKKLGTTSEESGKKHEETGKKVGFLEGQIGKLVTGGVLIAAGKALLDFGKASITAASDVEEMQSKFNTVFRELAGPVTQELEEFAEAANRSKFDLMGFAATLQDTFVPLGFARDQAADMSVTLVKLAEDLASFNNLNTEDVVRDLQSALVGNTETLRKYGVVAQETQIKQEALRAGLWDGTGAIDAQAKAQAILNLTIAGTTDAQGDAIKTADSYANTSKGLEAAFTDLKVVIGEGLLPLVTEFTQALTALVGGLAKDMQTQKQLTAAYEAGIITYKEWLALSRESRKQGGLNAETNEEYSEAVEELNSLLAKQAGEMGKVNQAAVEAAAADSILLTHTNDLVEAEDKRIQGIIDYSKAAAEAAAVDEELADKQAQLANQTGTTGQAVAAANLEMEKQIELEKEAAAAADLLRQNQADYFLTALDGDTVQDNLNQSIFDSVQAAGASAEQMAILGGALGLYSDEAVEAALKSAAIQVKIDELAKSYVAGDISVEGMRESIQDFIATLDGVPDEVSTHVSVSGVAEASAAVGNLQKQISGLGLPQHTASQVNELEERGGIGAAHGADFVVPSGFPNDSFGPIYAQSGERVTITPAGQGGASGGGNTTINVYQRPGENGRAFADRVATMVNETNGNLK